MCQLDKDMVPALRTCQFNGKQSDSAGLPRETYKASCIKYDIWEGKESTWA